MDVVAKHAAACEAIGLDGRKGSDRPRRLRSQPRLGGARAVTTRLVVRAPQSERVIHNPTAHKA